MVSYEEIAMNLLCRSRLLLRFVVLIGLMAIASITPVPSTAARSLYAATPHAPSATVSRSLDWLILRLTKKYGLRYARFIEIQVTRPREALVKSIPTAAKTLAEHERRLQRYLRDAHTPLAHLRAERWEENEVTRLRIQLDIMREVLRYRRT